MKPIGKKIVVEAYLGQKESLSIKGHDGKTIELWLGKKYVTNFREKNPVIAKVLSNPSGEFPYIKENDLILVHHNFLSDWKTNPYCIEYSLEENKGIFSIPLDRNVFCKLNDDGTVKALCHNIIVKRLKNPIKTNLIIVPDIIKQEHEDRVEVLGIAPEVEGIYPGQVVLIMDKSDYEICYTWQGQEYSIIKVFDEEVIGILN